MRTALRLSPHPLGELGRLEVPENRSDPDGRTIEIAFVRMPCTGERPGTPVVVLAGGPGGPAIAPAAQSERIAALASLGDVILLDQRGVGLSQPNLTTDLRFDLPLDEPGTHGALIAEGRRLAKLAATFWRERGVDLSGYTTEENADDVDAVRRALGAERVRLVGGSYGSHLALAVLRRHPGTVERAVLTGVEGPDDTIKLPSAVQAHLERVAGPGLLELMRSVMDRLERAPVTAGTPDGDDIVLGRFDLQRATCAAAGSRAAIAALPSAYSAIGRGDHSGLARHTIAERRRPFGNAMSWVMDAASGLSDERRTRIEAEAPGTLCGDVIDLPHPHVRDAIGAPDLGGDFRSPVRSDAEVLLISGSLDGRTPPANAEAVLAGLPNGAHVVVEGMSHDGGPPELASAIARYLETGEPPSALPAMPPFDG